MNALLASFSHIPRHESACMHAGASEQCTHTYRAGEIATETESVADTETETNTDTKTD